MQKYPMIPSYLNTFDLGVLRALTLSACFDIVYKNWTTQFPEKKPAIADYSKIKDAKLHLSILRTAVLNQTSKRLNPAPLGWKSIQTGEIRIKTQNYRKQ